MPQLRVLLVAVGRSLPGTVSFLFVGALILYVYAVIGWISFADHDPAHYGSLGRAGLTLFLLMTLEGLGDAVHAGLAVSPFSIIYYASYVLLASFVLVNVLIGVVLNALEEAREMEKEAHRAERAAPDPHPAAPDPGRVATQDADDLLLRIAAVRSALDDMEARLAPRERGTARHDRAGAGRGGVGGREVSERRCPAAAAAAIHGWAHPVDQRAAARRPKMSPKDK
ncbi:hypothetical protein GCM10020254_79490 [Streptomyces goshikiensis]